MSNDKEEKKGFFKRQGGKINSFLYKRTGINASIALAEDMKRDLKKIKSRKEEEKISFEEAYEKNGCSEEKLKTIYDNMKLAFYINFAILLIYLIFMIRLLINGDFTFYVLFLTIGFLPLVFSILISTSYRAYQVKNRNFCSFGEWLSDKKGWFPRGKVKSKSEVKFKRKDLF